MEIKHIVDTVALFLKLISITHQTIHFQCFAISCFATITLRVNYLTQFRSIDLCELWKGRRLQTVGSNWSEFYWSYSHCSLWKDIQVTFASHYSVTAHIHSEETKPVVHKPEELLVCSSMLILLIQVFS
jgi:hypothetical protein